MAGSASRPLHFVICPWLAFGHLLPCLELAHRLASRGHRVSFVSTPRNISRLPPLPPAVAPLVDFVPLPLAHVPGLPDGAEATSDVGDDKAELLRLASDGLAAPFSEFLRAAGGADKPDWLIVDIVNNWAAAAAAEHKVPCIALLQCAARMFTPMAGPMSHNDDWMKTYTVESPASGVSIAERCAITLKACKLAALRSCLEWEPDAVPLVKTHPQSSAPVVTLGLLPPPSTDRHGKDDDDATLRWLDAQPAKSVVYIALGSEVPLREEQVHEMALGLELSGTRFLWALRRPRDAAPDDDDADDVLPPGFEERTRGRGMVVFGWVPQVSILAHGAVAAFLTHCGWSSTIEGLQFGRPLVMLPIATGDQWPNARLMEERGVGLRVPRDGNDGSFHREGLAATVRAVTADQGGTFAANAGKLQLVVADRECHERCINGFIQQLTSYMD